MFEIALPRLEVEVGAFPVHLLVLEVKLDVALRRHLIGVGVVFGVVSAQARLSVVDIHVSVGDKNLAILALLLRLQLHDVSADGKLYLRRRSSGRRERRQNHEIP